MTPEPSYLPPSIEDAAAVADSCNRLIRRFAKLRTQIAAMARDDVDWSAQLLITKLALEGPIRSSALAELVQYDPSTVSRQVAALVKDGYVERRADPEDGRASLLVVTARGDAVYQEHRRLRNEHYQKMLAEWSEEECRVFVQLTTRFTDGIDQSWPVWFKNDTALPAAGRGPTNQHREA